MSLAAQIVERGAVKLGLALPTSAGSAFETYYDLLERRGSNVNLTAIAGMEDVARLHFLDSISLLKIADFKDARVVDVGSGAGFPGVPLLIAEPTIDLTLLDATKKRVAFLSELNAALNLNAACICARAEDAAHIQDMREQYGIALSRAVARLNILCELCLPFVRVDGIFLAMKSVDSAEEIAGADSAIEILGAKLERSVDYTIPGTDISHKAVIIRKISPTPEKYPRRFAKIQNSPL